MSTPRLVSSRTNRARGSGAANAALSFTNPISGEWSDQAGACRRRGTCHIRLGLCRQRPLLTADGDHLDGLGKLSTAPIHRPGATRHVIVDPRTTAIPSNSRSPARLRPADLERLTTKALRRGRPFFLRLLWRRAHASRKRSKSIADTIVQWAAGNSGTTLIATSNRMRKRQWSPPTRPTG